MARSLKKGPYVDDKLMKKVLKMNEKNDKSALKTWARSTTVVPDMIGHTFLVHNGKKFIKVFVQDNMIGHKLGEFSPTRMFRSHAKGNK